MDFTKLVSLFDSRALYFSRADKLNDPFEGSWPIINIARRDGTLRLSNADENIQHWPRYIAINCWHMNQYESAAMWKLYLKSDEGIAIQSTYARLKKSFIDDEIINLGKVKYIDYDTDFIEANDTAFVHKRKSFEHEQEVRALVLKTPEMEGRYDFNLETIKYGLQIKVDIETLIERIYIAPSTPDWFADLVKTIVAKYDYNFKVVHSRLDENPLF